MVRQEVETGSTDASFPAAEPVRGYPGIKASSTRNKWTVTSVLSQVVVYPDGSLHAGFDEIPCADSEHEDSGPVTVRNLKALFGDAGDNPCQVAAAAQLEKAGVTDDVVLVEFFDMLHKVIHAFINDNVRTGRITRLYIAMSYFTGEDRYD
jgi:hypothetical protein